MGLLNGWSWQCKFVFLKDFFFRYFLYIFQHVFLHSLLFFSQSLERFAWHRQIFCMAFVVVLLFVMLWFFFVIFLSCLWFFWDHRKKVSQDFLWHNPGPYQKLKCRRSGCRPIPIPRNGLKNQKPQRRKCSIGQFGSLKQETKSIQWEMFRFCFSVDRSQFLVTV